MVASTTAWDLTGSKSNLPSGTGSKSSTGTGGSTSTVSETSSQFQFADTRNTPQSSLDALQQLIEQLSDRPRLSDEEAAAQFPLSERVFDRRAGWGYKLPNGSTVYGPEAQAHAKRWDAMQIAKRKQAQQASGVIPGGTVATSEQSAQRRSLTQDLTKQQAGYSKEAAFADAASLAGRFQRQLLETLMPDLNKAIEGSGTSGGAVAGLLAQDAATRVAEAQAALGLQTASQYGQISNQVSSLLAQLSSVLPPELQALLQALGVSKGTINQGVTGGSTTSNKTVQTSESKSGQETQVQQGGNPLVASGSPLVASGIKLVPLAGAPNASQSAPNVVGATPATLEQTLQQIVKTQEFGGGFRF